MSTNGLNVVVYDGKVVSTEAVIHNSYPQNEGLNFLQSLKTNLNEEHVKNCKPKTNMSLEEHKKIWKCKWVYVADFDAKLFQVYECSNNNSIVLVKAFNLNNLPSEEEFLKELENVE